MFLKIVFIHLLTSVKVHVGSISKEVKREVYLDDRFKKKLPFWEFSPEINNGKPVTGNITFAFDLCNRTFAFDL